MDRLLLVSPYFTDEATGTKAVFDWLAVDDDSGAQIEGRCTLDEIRSELASHGKDAAEVEIVLVVPDNELLFTRQDIPGRSAARIRQAAPFAIEPYLTTELHDTHVAIGDARAKAGVATVAIGKERLQTYLSVVENCGLSVTCLTALSLLQPVGENSIAAWLYDGRFTMVTADQMVAVDASAANRVIANIAQQDSAEDLLNLALYVEDETTATVSSVRELSAVNVQIQKQSALAYVVANYDPRTALNLLQGEFEPKFDHSVLGRKWFQTYTVVMAIGILCALIFTSEGLWARYQAQQALEASISLFEEQYGTYNGLENPAYLLQKRSPAKITSGNIFGRYLTAVAKHKKDIDISELRYDEITSSLSLVMTSTDFGRQEQFKDALSSDGLTVEFSSVEQAGDIYQTSVKVSP